MNFEKLLTEREFAELQQKVERFECFDFVKLDKANRIELRIYADRTDYHWWSDFYFCCIDGSRKYGDCLGFGSPYQRAEFLRLQYADVLQMFARAYGYEMPKQKQINMFDLLLEQKRSIV